MNALTTETRLIVIVGPTAGGKSEFAVALAEHLGQGRAQVINADSMQVYRGMDAGTAKPSPELRERIEHHLIDIVEPTERFTVADWLHLAERTIQSLQAQGVRPIVVGGTNLYIKALLEGLFPGPSADMAYRSQLADIEPQALHDQLAAVDPASAHKIHRNDRKKLVRALEVYHVTGKPISQWQSQWSEPAPAVDSSDNTDQGAAGSAATVGRYQYDPVMLGLEWPTEVINRRINQRVKQMFFPCGGDAELDKPTEDLVSEVRMLTTSGKLGGQASQAIGYKQIMEYIAGGCTLDDAFEQTKIITRRFAKSQRTWLRRYRDVHWLDSANQSLEELVTQAEPFVKCCK